MKKSTKLTLPLFIASVLLSSQSLAANNDKIASECEQLGMEVLLLADTHYSEQCAREVSYSATTLINSANFVKAGDSKKGLANLLDAKSRLAKVANSPKRCAYFSPLIKPIMPMVTMLQHTIEQESTTTTK
ncbi:MAG: hypothetical protein H0U70_07175 [Tatlockia sp.]|nr:hypothetical protein [Tatlockia sp.]